MRQFFPVVSPIVLGVTLTAVGYAQGSKTPDQVSNEEKVYQKSEVTRPAIIKSRPEAHGDIVGCPEGGGAVRVRLVLHKSGKVTEVKLISGLGEGCSFEKNAMKAASKVTFVPAVKDGVAVSQYLTLEYVYR